MGSWFFLITTRVLVVALLPLPRASFSAYTASFEQMMSLDFGFSICVVCGGESVTFSLCALCVISVGHTVYPSVNVFPLSHIVLSLTN